MSTADRPKTSAELASSPRLSAEQTAALARLTVGAPGLLQHRIAAVLEQNAGRCLDDEADRHAVLTAIMEALNATHQSEI